MLNDEIVGRWHHLRNNVQHYWARFAERDFFHKEETPPKPIHIDNYHYESHRVDEFPPIFEERRRALKRGVYDESESSNEDMKEYFNKNNSFEQDDNSERRNSEYH